MIKIALCQLRTELELEETMTKAHRMVTEATRSGAEIVALPEMFNCPYDRAYFKRFAALGHEAAVSAMSSWARELGILLVGGSVPETEGDQIYNTCFVFDQQGRQIARHRKVHLFDVDLPGMRFKESNTFTPGEDITVFDTEYGRMGCAVCFDVRFPELFRTEMLRGSLVQFLVAEWTEEKVLVWDIMNRSRAIENLCYLSCTSPGGVIDGVQYSGHSAVYGPLGECLALGGRDEEIVTADLDVSHILATRRAMDVYRDRRPDVYDQ